MADRELRRMHRAELIEIIYALKQSEDQLKAQNAALTAQLQDRQLRGKRRFHRAGRAGAEQRVRRRAGRRR